MENCIKTGAYVALPDYGIFAPADIFAVGNKFVVRFNGDLDVHGSFVQGRTPTHILYLNRNENYWRKDLGIAVVDESDLLQTNPVKPTQVKE